MFVKILDSHYRLNISDKQLKKILLNAENSIASIGETSDIAGWLLDNVGYDINSYAPIGTYKKYNESEKYGGRIISQAQFEDSNTHLYPNYREYCEQNWLMPQPYLKFCMI